MKLVNSATRMRVPTIRCSARPMDEASMAQAPRPASANCLNARCRRTGSGVVMPVLVSAGGVPMPKVPTTAHPSCPYSSFFDSTLRASANHQLVLVLPLVPVTASTSRACVGCSNQSAAIRPVAAFSPCSAATGSPVSANASAPSCSTRQATAPRASASPMCARPSVAAPGQAMKPSPGRIWRLSVCSVPVTRSRSQATASCTEVSRGSGVAVTATPPPRSPRSAA